MSVLDFFWLIVGYLLLLCSTEMMRAGCISMMRVKPTADAQERIVTWLAECIMPYLILGITGGIVGVGNMMFAAALSAGVLQLLLIFGMIGISGSYHMGGNVLRELVILLVCVVILILFTNYTWSNGHPATVVGRGAGVFLLVLAVLFALWTMPYFMGRSRTLKRPPALDFVPSAALALAGVAMAGLGSALMINNAASLTHDFRIGQGLLGFAVIGVGITIPQYVRVAKRFWMNSKRPIMMRETIATGNLGLLLLIGITALISPITVTFDGAVLLIGCMFAILGFGAAFYFDNKVGRIKAAAFLATYMIIFGIFMWMSILS